MKIGIIHPGAMGAELGRVLSASHEVLWLGHGRSVETRERATAAGFIEAETLADLVTRSDFIISICPPHGAMEVAGEVAGIRSDGFMYIDAKHGCPGHGARHRRNVRAGHSG